MEYRIMIVGCCGSGKSTLAKELHKNTKLPLYHLDRLYFGPKWSRPDVDSWRNKQLELVKDNQWIIDGNYKSTMDIRLDRATHVIFMDIGRVTCLYRAIKRTLTSKHRTDMADGCNERFDMSFYKYIWNYDKYVKPQVLDMFAKHPDVEVLTIKNKKDIDFVLKYFEKENAKA